MQLQQAKQDGTTIKVTVKNNGSVREGVMLVTTSMDIAKQLDKKVVKAALSASVDGEVWDLTRPLERDCTLQFPQLGGRKGERCNPPPFLSPDMPLEQPLQNV